MRFTSCSTVAQKDRLEAMLLAAVNDSPAYSEARNARLLLVGKEVVRCPSGEKPFNHARAVKAAKGDQPAKKPITSHLPLVTAGKVRACMLQAFTP